jgi:hypothetical protein
VGRGRHKESAIMTINDVLNEMAAGVTSIAKKPITNPE